MPELQNQWVVIKWTFQNILFVTVFFPSYYWNKFACLNPLYLCYFLEYLAAVLLCHAQYLLLKSSKKFRNFIVTILYHLFIWKKYLAFPISNRNKSDDKKVTDYRNIHNPAYVFWTCPNSKIQGCWIKLHIPSYIKIRCWWD